MSVIPVKSIVPSCSPIQTHNIAVTTLLSTALISQFWFRSMWVLIVLSLIHQRWVAVCQNPTLWTKVWAFLPPATLIIIIIIKPTMILPNYLSQIHQKHQSSTNHPCCKKSKALSTMMGGRFQTMIKCGSDLLVLESTFNPSPMILMMMLLTKVCWYNLVTCQNTYIKLQTSSHNMEQLYNSRLLVYAGDGQGGELVIGTHGGKKLTCNREVWLYIHESNQNLLLDQWIELNVGTGSKLYFHLNL